MMKTKFKVYTTVLTLILLVSSFLIRGCMEQERSRYSNNIKAQYAQNDSLKNVNRVFKYKVEELELLNDSITQALLKTSRELKIKDKRIAQLSYVRSISTRVDTVVFRDTLFRNDLKIDTALQDEWYSLKLRLEYPNKILVEPSFISEKHIIVNSKRETVGKPHWFFLFRWFQKRHTVLEVNVVEKNPYIKELDNKFIEVIE